MRLGVSSYFFSAEGFKTFISECVDRGITSVEIAYELPFMHLLDGAFFERIKHWAREGVSFSMHGPWVECNLGSSFKEIRDFSRRRIMKAIDLASESGMNPFVLHPGYTFLLDRRWQVEEKARAYFCDELLLLCQYAQRRGVQLSLENMPFTFSLFSEVSDFDSMKGAHRVGMCYDVGHAIISKRQKGITDPQKSIASDLRSHRSHISHLHLHNNFGSRDEHALYSGLVDLGEIVHVLKEIDFEGVVVIESSEIETQGFDAFCLWATKYFS